MNNVILVGFMGSGKTCVGKSLSSYLRRPFADIDDLIVKETGQSIIDIFRNKGEDYFRRLEKAIIARECFKSGRVISLGGGAFLDPDNRQVCLSGQNSVYFLNTSWDYIRKRLELLRQSRPLLIGKKDEEVKELFYKRQNTYKHAHFEISIEDFADFDEVAAHIACLITPGLKEDCTAKPRACGTPAFGV